MKTASENKRTSLWRSFFLFTLILSLSLRMVAQGPGGGPPSAEDRAKKQTEKMKTELKLTAAQEPKVQAINLKYAKKMDALRKESDQGTDRMKQFENLSKEKEAELKPILTADQMKGYQKMMEEYKNRMMNGRK